VKQPREIESESWISANERDQAVDGDSAPVLSHSKELQQLLDGIWRMGKRGISMFVQEFN